MHLHDLLIGLPILAISSSADVEISSLAYDSRAVRPGSAHWLPVGLCGVRLRADTCPA